MNESKGGKNRPTLEDLFEDRSIDDSGLAAALVNKVILTKDAQNVSLVDDFAQAPIKKRLVAVGLALHALLRRNLITEEELARPTAWYAEQTQERPKTVGELLSQLKGRRLFERTENGYRVPGWAVRKAVAYLGE